MFKEITKAFGRYVVGDLLDYPKPTWDRIEQSARKDPKLGRKFKLADYTKPIGDGPALERIQRQAPLRPDAKSKAAPAPAA